MVTLVLKLNCKCFTGPFCCIMMGGINGMHSGTVAVLLVQSTLQCITLHYSISDRTVCHLMYITLHVLQATRILGQLTRKLSDPVRRSNIFKTIEAAPLLCHSQISIFLEASPDRYTTGI